MANFKIFKYPLIIKEQHLDTFAHVNNATYLALFEEARWDFLNAHGFDLKTILAKQVGPIVLECHIKFLKEVLLRQSIMVESRLLSFEGKIGVMQQKMINDSGDSCCEAEMIFGFFDLKDRKLISAPESWLRAIEG